MSSEVALAVHDDELLRLYQVRDDRPCFGVHFFSISSFFQGAVDGFSQHLQEYVMFVTPSLGYVLNISYGHDGSGH